MAAPKRMTHVVTHKKLYLMTGGKLQHVVAGTELRLDAKIAKGLGSKIKKLGEGKQIDLTGDAPDFSKMNLKQLTAACKKANIEVVKDAKEEDLIKLLEAPAE